jgi:polysaccharide chain length determinant protein (PEP-CTERM system associated)
MNTQEVPSSLADYFGILRRRRIYLLTVLPAALLLSVYLAFALTPSYRSSATILLEASSIPTDLVQRTVSSYADQQIELVSRRVLTPENLEAVVAEVDPYPGEKDLSPRDKARQIIADTLIERVDPITLEVLQESNAFSIHYHNEDPRIAAKIAQRISALFLDYNRRTRSERADAAYTFLLAQSRDVERRIGEVEQNIAQFKTRHGSALPEMQLRNQGSAERASRELMDLEGQIRAAEERQALLNVQLSKLNPTLGSITGNPQTELATLQGQLADARVRYTPDHPDVKRLERQIEAASAKAGAEVGSTERIVPNNPEYLGVQSQIFATQREIAALQVSAARARGQIYEYEAGTAAAPSVEREYAELTRGRDVLRAQFNDIQGKLREADIARNLETEQKGDRFSQIRSPGVADMPYSPNRLGIILLGVVLGGGLSVGLAAVAETSDPAVRGPRDLQAITGIPAIASVPVMLNQEARRKQLVWWGSYATVLLAATAFVVMTVVTA